MFSELFGPKMKGRTLSECFALTASEYNVTHFLEKDVCLTHDKL